MTLLQSNVRRLAAGAVLAISVLSLTACGPVTSVTFAGHGWGHGRGMGQWGAYGYAVDQGKDWQWILDHFYGGTILRTRTQPPNPDQRVWLRANRGRDLLVEQPRGHLTVAGLAAPSTAVRVERVDATRWRVSDATTCAGPWTPRPTLVSAAELVVAPTKAATEDREEMLRLCEAGGKRLLRGALVAVHVGSSIDTVNRVATEDLIRSVIAREVSPSWAGAGGNKGFQALMAQAVAARSYASAGDTRWGAWATTCDGGSCQTYSGVAYAPSGSSWQTYEDPRTDLAVGATASMVRVFPSTGRIAATEFSASTGGYTKGPTFTPVVDDGDATAPNPNHNWSVTIPVGTIQSQFNAREGRDLGSFVAIDVLQRDGRGIDGGRPTSVRVQFANATVTLTGDQVRQTLALKSDWFTPTANS
ncbi:MAG: SpoIID/LytB domain protein [Acidimicrobiales bacterium]|nr:SpoIID/LytB domain protein [Acidimicrobiales bacterium]